ncbi:MAG: energy-coupled thiamine transporter ThiT [Bacilli bacterium]|jgi:thiamine transporter|nr:energy-coupled thiamine transporter ThiT [Bacilli bacterium]
MFKTKDLVVIALISAISYLLSMLVVFRMPQGGSITLYLVPLLLAAFNDKFRNCLLIGLITSLLQIVLGGYFLNPVQVCFDYVIPVTLICISGYIITRNNNNILTNILGFIIACVLALLSYVCSGMLFYETPFVPSIIYNATFFVPTIIINLIIILIINKPLSKVYPK